MLTKSMNQVGLCIVDDDHFDKFVHKHGTVALPRHIRGWYPYQHSADTTE